MTVKKCTIRVKPDKPNGSWALVTFADGRRAVGWTLPGDNDGQPVKLRIEDYHEKKVKTEIAKTLALTHKLALQGQIAEAEAPEVRSPFEPGKSVKIDNVSRMTGEEFAVAWKQIEQDEMTRNEILVAHFTSVPNAELILGSESHGLRASTLGQGGGGLSVVHVANGECAMTVLGWEQYQGGKFRSTAGELLWGEKASNVLEGGQDADKLDVVFLLAVQKQWIEAAVTVPGRELIKVVPPSQLEEHDGFHFCPLSKVKRVYVLNDAKTLSVPDSSNSPRSHRRFKSRAQVISAFIPQSKTQQPEPSKTQQPEPEPDTSCSTSDSDANDQDEQTEHHGKQNAPQDVIKSQVVKYLVDTRINERRSDDLVMHNPPVCATMNV